MYVHSSVGVDKWIINSVRWFFISIQHRPARRGGKSMGKMLGKIPFSDGSTGSFRPWGKAQAAPNRRGTIALVVSPMTIGVKTRNALSVSILRPRDVPISSWSVLIVCFVGECTVPAHIACITSRCWREKNNSETPNGHIYLSENVAKQKRTECLYNIDVSIVCYRRWKTRPNSLRVYFDVLKLLLGNSNLPTALY